MSAVESFFMVARQLIWMVGPEKGWWLVDFREFVVV